MPHAPAIEVEPPAPLRAAFPAIASVLASSLINGDASPSGVLPRARAAAGRAVGTGPATAEAQLALAYLKWCCEWEWPAAEASFRLALTLDPQASQAHLALGHALSQMGRHGEAMLSTRRARELDPLSAIMPALSSQVAFQSREALEQLGEHESAPGIRDW